MDDVGIPSGLKNQVDANYELNILHKILLRLLVKKSPTCKHTDPCVNNAIKGFIKNFIYGYGIKLGAQLLVMLLKRKFKLGKIFENLTSINSFQFALFLSLVSFLYKSTLCTMRRFNRKHDDVNSVIAGLM
jgi:hypothetical protein